MTNQALSTIERSYTQFMVFLMLSKHAVFELASAHELTGMQAVVLCLLDKPYRMNALSKLFNCDPSNMTGIVDGLEQKQMVTRYSDKLDHRSKMVDLNPKGRRVRKQLIAEICGADGYILKNLTTEEAEQFAGLINKINTAGQDRGN